MPDVNSHADQLFDHGHLRSIRFTVSRDLMTMTTTAAVVFGGRSVEVSSELVR